LHLGGGALILLCDCVLYNNVFLRELVDIEVIDRSI
jgi:hypothetical protein